MSFKVGDRVRILDTVPASWWFTPGALATVETVSVKGYRLKFDVAHYNGYSIGFVNDEHIELMRKPTIADDLRLTPQAKTVLGHLKRHGRISPAEADRVYGYTRLASCIHEIRHKAGYAVKTELRRDDHGGKYAKYTLAVN